MNKRLQGAAAGEAVNRTRTYGKYTMIWLTGALALLCFSLPGISATSPDRQKNFADKDLDRNERLERNDYISLCQDNFKRLDQNGDGFLSMADLETIGPRLALLSSQASSREKIIQRYRGMDTNQDERVGLEEFLAYRRKQFAAMDKNSDATVTFNEYTAFKSGNRGAAADKNH